MASHKRRHFWRGERLARILGDYKAGVPLKTMSHAHDVCMSTICRLAKEAGLPSRRSSWRPQPEPPLFAFILSVGGSIGGLRSFRQQRGPNGGIEAHP